MLNTNVICESSLITKKNITELAKTLLCAIIRWSLVSKYLAIYNACKIILACFREENTYYHFNEKITGKSFSEALILASTNP
jgi:hypothetical protein